MSQESLFQKAIFLQLRVHLSLSVFVGVLTTNNNLMAFVIKGQTDWNPWGKITTDPMQKFIPLSELDMLAITFNMLCTVITFQALA
jgi:hypothetical protein